MWTRWRCRRCYNNIPAGLHEKYGQAVAAKSGEWSTGSSASSGEEDGKARSLEAENKELTARIDAMEKKEKHKKVPGIPLKKKGTWKKCGETVWMSTMRLSVAENWMNRGKSCRRSNEMSTDYSCVKGNAREPEGVTCSASCKKWRKGGPIPCLNTRRCIRERKRYKASRTEGEMCRKGARQRRKKCGNSEKKLSGRKLASDKVDKNRMADAEMEAELQGLQAGEYGRGSNASQAADCCLETMVEQVFAVGHDQARSTFGALFQIFFREFETSILPAQMPGREEGRRDSENEQEQGRASQQLV